MADNSVQTGADTIRDKDRAGVKTQIVGLDLNVSGTETLMAGTMPISVATGIRSRQSAYSAAAANVFTGAELTTLAAANYSAPSTAIDNGALLDLYDDLELVVSLAATPAANTLIEVYLIPSLDGTNYADAASGTATPPAPNLYVGGFPVKAITTAQRLILRGVPIPPGLFKYALRNGTAVAFTATATPQVRRRSYSMQLG